MTKPIGIASDHAGLEQKSALITVFEAQGLSVRDFGTNTSSSCDYPDFAHAVALSISNSEIDRAVLVCGTGVGMSIAANRHAAIRAVVCSEPLSARMSRQHNDANVLCLGSRVVGQGMAAEIANIFLSTDFEGGRHAARVAKLNVASPAPTAST